MDKRGDSLRNGAVMGALVGAALGVLATKEVGFTVVGAGVYAAIGTGFDALIQGRTTLYEAPGRNSARQNRSGRAGGAEVMALRATVSW